MGLDQYITQNDNEVITLRKENAIHAWFVDHCNNGVEINCSPVEISPKDIIEFRDVVRTVIADRSKAPDLLPTREGFFFGSTDYDDWYFRGLDDTLKALDNLNLEAGPVVYDAWW